MVRDAVIKHNPNAKIVEAASPISLDKSDDYKHISGNECL